MRIDLGDHFEAFVLEQVATGRYANASEVVREGLRLLEDRERKLDWLRAELAIAEEQVQRGELIDYTPEFLDRLSREAEEEAFKGKPIKDAVKP